MSVCVRECEDNGWLNDKFISYLQSAVHSHILVAQKPNRLNTVVQSNITTNYDTRVSELNVFYRLMKT